MEVIKFKYKCGHLSHLNLAQETSMENLNSLLYITCEKCGAIFVYDSRDVQARTSIVSFSNLW